MMHEGMGQGFLVVSAENAFDRDSQIIAPIFKINVGERYVFELYPFFFHNPPTFRRKVGGAFAFLFPLGERRGRGGFVCKPFPRTFLTKLIAKDTPRDASKPRKPPYCAAPPVTTPCPTRCLSTCFF